MLTLDWSLGVLIMGAYLLGAVTFAPLVCWAAGLPDPRLGGSKNPGATNVLRLAGKPWAALVLFLDACKGLLPVLLAGYLGKDFSIQNWVLIAAVIGHVFPIYFSFQGGKGIATFLGGILGLSPLLAGIFVGIWLLIFAVSRISALAALVALLVTLGVSFMLFHSWPLLGLGGFLLWTHRDNWRRLWAGKEAAFKGAKAP